MRRAVLRAFVTVALCAAGLAGVRAAAATAPAPLVREAAIVCGGNGCNPVPLKAEKRRKFQPLGYTKPVKQSALPARAATA
jgi:hypothetical protein